MVLISFFIFSFLDIFKRFDRIVIMELKRNVKLLKLDLFGLAIREFLLLFLSTDKSFVPS